MLTGKVAEVSPAATVTLDGTLATFEFELDNDTVIPPAGAAALSLTLPVTVSPARTSLLLRLSVLRVTDDAAGTGLTVKDAFLLTVE